MSTTHEPPTRIDYLARVLDTYRPGSREHDWADEFYELVTRDPDRMRDLIASIETDGILEPIILGDDGRVWDGHHRITAAKLLNMRTIPIVYAEEARQ